MYSPPSIYNAYPEVNIKIDKDIDADYLLIEGSDNSNAILYWSYGNGTLLDATRDAGGYLFDFADRIGTTEIHGGNYSDVMIGGANTDILLGGLGNDILRGGAGNDVLEGGDGGDTLTGGTDTDTASYEHATGGVYVRLDMKLGLAGEAANDVLDGIENLIGSVYDDILAGDDNGNKIVGNGGSDDIYSYGGDDRLVISDTPIMINGGFGNDLLFVVGENIVTLTDSTFTQIEEVYVRNGAILEMSGVSTGARIVSQTTDQHFTEITGTSGRDIISAGKGFDEIYGGNGNDVIRGGNGTGPGGLTTIHGENGDDVITAGKGIAYITGNAGDDTIRGGAGIGLLSGGVGNDRITAGDRGFDIDGGDGADKLFAGAGEDTFYFQAGFGRDNVYKFDTSTDHIIVDIAGATGVTLKAFHGGQDTIVTFAGVEGTNKVILHDVTVDQIKEGPSDLFTFGA